MPNFALGHIVAEHARNSSAGAPGVITADEGVTVTSAGRFLRVGLVDFGATAAAALGSVFAAAGPVKADGGSAAQHVKAAAGAAEAGAITQARAGFLCICSRNRVDFI